VLDSHLQICARNRNKRLGFIHEASRSRAARATTGSDRSRIRGQHSSLSVATILKEDKEISSFTCAYASRSIPAEVSSTPPPSAILRRRTFSRLRRWTTMRTKKLEQWVRFEMKRVVSSCSLATPICLISFAIGAFVGFVICHQVDSNLSLKFLLFGLKSSRVVLRRCHERIAFASWHTKRVAPLAMRTFTAAFRRKKFIVGRERKRERRGRRGREG